jgi:hypothetical protein
MYLGSIEISHQRNYAAVVQSFDNYTIIWNYFETITIKASSFLILNQFLLHYLKKKWTNNRSLLETIKVSKIMDQYSHSLTSIANFKKFEKHS